MFYKPYKINMVSESNETGLKTLKLNNWQVFLIDKLNQLYVKGDLCDVTLKFGDGSTVQAHKVVLKACTSFFEHLPSTTTGLVLKMPSVMKVHHIRPIINFMYSGKLEFAAEDQPHILTAARNLGIHVITELLQVQVEPLKKKIDHKKFIEKQVGVSKSLQPISHPLPVAESTPIAEPQPRPPGKRLPIWKKRSTIQIPDELYQSVQNQLKMPQALRKPVVKQEPRPTRFEWPEEGEEGQEAPPEAQFANTHSFTADSFEDLSYDSKIIVQRVNGPKPVVTETSIDKMPESNASVSQRAKRVRGPEIVQTHCDVDDDDYDDGHFETIHDFEDSMEDDEDVESHTSVAPRSVTPVNATPPKPILKSHSSPTPSKKVRFTFSAENKTTLKSSQEKCSSNSPQAQPLTEANHSPPAASKKPATTPTVSAPLNHAKIINEIFKKYPELVKNNKNIKLKIKTSSNPTANALDKSVIDDASGKGEKKVQYMVLKSDFTNARKEVKTEPTSGPENRTGPWFCVPCANELGPMNFETYYNYRKHLQEVHNERVDARICEHCGFKSSKRNLHLYHLYTKHNVPPPRNINFPKCDHCEYIALSESLLIKHRSNHTGLINKEYICRVCNAAFKSNGALMGHMQTNLHRNLSEQMTKRDYECEFCGKVFNRNINLRAHIRTVHHEENRKMYEDEDKDDPLQVSQSSESDVMEVIEVPVYDSVPGNKTLYLSQGMTILAESPNAPLMPSSESEAMNNVATGIATSINIADRNIANDVIVLDSPSELVFRGTPASYVLNQDGSYSVQEYIVPEIMSDSGQVYTTALVSSAPATGITYVNSDNISIIASGSDHTYADGVNITGQLTTVATSNGPTVISSQANQSSRPIVVQEPIIVSGDWVPVQSIATSQQQPLTQKFEIISASRPRATEPTSQPSQSVEAPVKAAHKLVSDWGDLEEENDDEAETEDTEVKPSRPTIDLDVNNDMDM